MKRTLLSLLLSFLLLFSLCSGAFCVTFPDIAGHVHEDAILRAVELGIIRGYDDGTFRPDGGVTRAEFCAMTNRALGIAGVSPLDFTDVPVSSWFFGDVRSAVTAGYILGMPGNRFEPAGPITRYQSALIFARLAGFTAGSEPLAYADADSVPDWARQGAAFAQESGVFDAFVTDTLDGQKPLTRAETAAALTALLDRFDKRPVFCTLVTADDGNQPLDTETLYKNEYAYLSFLVSGRDLARDLDPDDLQDDLQFRITGAIGIRTLNADGQRVNVPAYTACTKLDDNTLRFDVTLDRADYLPAWLTASVELPEGGAAAAGWAVRSEPVFVKYTAISEYLPTADSPLVLHRAVSTANRVVHRYLSWISHPAADYHVEFCVFDADDNVVSRRAYGGAYTQHGERIEIDMTEYITPHPEAAYGAGAYQAVCVTAESDSRSCRFYPSTLPLSAAKYVQLSLDGHDESRAAVVKDGVALTLTELHLDALAGSDDYTCGLTVTVLDAEHQDVTKDFALDGAWPLGQEADFTAAASGLTAELGTLTASADPGVYTLLLQFSVQSPQAAHTLYLSGALIVE